MLRETKCKILFLSKVTAKAPSQIVCERLGWDNIPDTEMFLS